MAEDRTVRGMLRWVPLLVGLGAFGVAVACGFAQVVFVTGESMYPTLKRGDVCLVVSGGDVVEGAVVLVERNDGSRVIHRVVDARDDTIETRGDANTVVDRDSVPRSQIRGRVVARIALGSVLEQVAHSLAGWYTRQPIAQLEAMTEMRPLRSAPRSGRGPDDCKDLRGQFGRFTPSAAT